MMNVKGEPRGGRAFKRKLRRRLAAEELIRQQDIVSLLVDRGIISRVETQSLSAAIDEYESSTAAVRLLLH